MNALATDKPHVASGSANGEGRQSTFWGTTSLYVGQVLLAATLVLSLLIPCDSIAVEQGAALYLCLLAIPTLTLALVYWPLGPQAGRQCELLLLVLLVWLGLSTMCVAGVGDLRAAMNEWCVWFALFSSFASARRLLGHARQKHAVTSILLVTVFLLSVHTLHQEFVSNPELLSEYEKDPTATLQSVGINPGQAARRMQFEGRLYAAEAMATFSLSTSAGIVLAIGIVLALICTTRFTGSARFVFLLFLTLNCLGLWFTGSKIMLGFVVIFVGFFALGRVRPIAAKATALSKHKLFAAVVILTPAVLVVSLTFVGGWVASSNEWMQKLSASIVYRFQYWSSSFAMLWDHLCFGVGPGNFQSQYAKYKFASASELIADPHNLLMETATSGGAVAGVVLVLLLCVCARDLWQHDDSARDDECGGNPKFLLAGFGAGLFLTWTVGLMFGVSPDIEPYLISVPLGVLFMVVIQKSVLAIAFDRSALAVCVLMGYAGLLLCGGWTIPGIALPLWVMLGMSNASPRANGLGNVLPRFRLASAGVGGICLALFLFAVLNPSLKASVFRESAMREFAAGRADEAVSLASQAVSVDRWDSRNTALLASLETALCTSVRKPDLPSWRAAVDALLASNSSSPRVWLQVGESRLSVYQRLGLKSLLDEAAADYENLVELDPTNAVVWAQRGMICEALGEMENSNQSWAEAQRIASLNSNSDARWNVLFAMPVMQIDDPSARIPVRISLEKAWANRISSGNVGPGQ